jgi:hypothetical protein
MNIQPFKQAHTSALRTSWLAMEIFSPRPLLYVMSDQDDK